MAQGTSGNRAGGADTLMTTLHEIRNSRKVVERKRKLLRRELDECDDLLRVLDDYEAEIQESLTALKETLQPLEINRDLSVDPHGSQGGVERPRGSHHRMREGTIKADCYRVLQERGTFMTTREIAEALAKRGRKFQYRYPIDVLGGVLRKSIQRRQGLFVKDGRKFGLQKWG